MSWLSHASYAQGGCSSASFQVASKVGPGVPFAGEDLNRDGHNDLAMVNGVDNEVVILLARGGTNGFDTPTSFPTGAGPTMGGVRDFNGDSKWDLVTGNRVSSAGTGSVSILLGGGDGSFGPPININLTYMPGSLVVSDLNGDGKSDLLIGIEYGRIAILLSDGQGGLYETSNSPFLVENSGQDSMVVGDFNEDGKADLACPIYPYGVGVLLGDGTGNFAGATVFSTTNIAAASLVAGDFNSDGHLDVAGVYALGVFVMSGNGSGSLNAPLTTNPIGFSSYLVSAGDFNGDGNTDLIANGLAGLVIVLGDGLGHFVTPKTYV